MASNADDAFSFQNGPSLALCFVSFSCCPSCPTGTMGADSDVYLHNQRNEHLALLRGFVDGLFTFSETTDVVKDLKVEVLDRELAWGFYRWPRAWHISGTGSQGPAVLTLK